MAILDDWVTNPVTVRTLGPEEEGSPLGARRVGLEGVVASFAS